jgi:hypothetical protein
VQRRQDRRLRPFGIALSDLLNFGVEISHEIPPSEAKGLAPPVKGAQHFSR